MPVERERHPDPACPHHREARGVCQRERLVVEPPNPVRERRRLHLLIRLDLVDERVRLERLEVIGRAGGIESVHKFR